MYFINIYISSQLFIICEREIQKKKNNKIVHTASGGERDSERASERRVHTTHMHAKRQLSTKRERNTKTSDFFSTVFMSTKVSFDFFLLLVCFVLLRAAAGAGVLLPLMF